MTAHNDPASLEGQPFVVVRRLLPILGVLCTAVGVLATLLYFGLQRQPSFYRAALNRDVLASQASGDQFEYQIFNLRNDIRNAGHWFATFTAEQVNGWLATDLLEKFPTAIPPGVDSPRIAIEHDRLHLGFRLTNSTIRGVISVGGELFCTDQPNQIGFRLDYVCVGWIPVPIGQWADNIASHFNAVGLPMRWTEFEGAPVALVQLPRRLRDDNTLRFTLSSFELRDGELCIGGHTNGDQPAYIAAQELLTDSLHRFGMISRLQRLSDSSLTR